MGGGVGVTASHGHSWLGQAKLGSNHMHDPLATTTEAVECDAMPLAIPLQGAEHFLCKRIREWPSLAEGGNDVVDGGHRALRTAHRQTFLVESGKSLGAGYLMNQVQTDEQLCGTARQICDTMQIPDLVVEGSAAHSRSAVNSQP